MEYGQYGEEIFLEEKIEGFFNKFPIKMIFIIF